MATILKVHGTFASGPEEGDKWWQRGSECCQQVGELVEAEDGQLKIEPFVWDGLNSERSRQAAAAKLLDRMGELEKAGEPYCVVGHSHGGSVISAALLRAAFYKRPLEKLSRWITIGTPFIDMRRSRLLFARLGPFGKTAFLGVFGCLVGIILAEGSNTLDASKWDLSMQVMALTAMFLVIAYPLLWVLARNRLHWHQEKVLVSASKSYGDRWLSMRHEDDEAVQGLGAFQSVRHPIFPRNFAIAPLSRMAIILVPIVSYFAFLHFAATPQPTDNPAAGAKVENVGSATTQTSQSATAAKDSPAAKTSTTSAQGSYGLTRQVTLVLTAIAVLVGVFVFVPIVMYYLINWASRPASIVLSHGLNALTWSQIRRSSLGNDIDGEIARHAGPQPTWLKATSRPLPSALSREIASVSDAAAAASIAKFRAALSDLSFYQIDQDGRDSFNAFLTGDELIHTTYFKIPRFRKLLAYSIAQSPGFRPSAALRADPDFPLIEQWYRELTAVHTPPPLPKVVQPAVVAQPN